MKIRHALFILAPMLFVITVAVVSCTGSSPGTIDPNVFTGITPNHGTLTPAFDPSVTTYTLNLKNRYSTLDLGLNTNSSLITVNGQPAEDMYDIPVGSTAFTIAVNSSAGDVEYTLNVNRARQFVYVSNVNTGGADSPLNLYSINPVNGQLEPLTPATTTVGNNPYDLFVSPNGENLYVANEADDTISQFSLDFMTGSLTPLSPATVAQPGFPYAMTMTADSRHMYCPSGDVGVTSFYQYDVSTSGAITPKSVPSVTTGSRPWFATISPNSRFVYLTIYNSNGAADTVAQFSVNATTGALAPLSPPTVAAQNQPWHINITPSGTGAYVVNNGTGSLSAYDLSPTTGQLSLIGHYSVGTAPVGLTIDPTGRFVYVANSGSNTVSMFSRAEATNLLTPIGGGTVPVANAPFGLEVDNDGQYLYVARSGTNSVAQFAIDQTTGALTPLSPANVNAGTNPRFIRISR